MVVTVPNPTDYREDRSGISSHRTFRPESILSARPQDSRIGDSARHPVCSAGRIVAKRCASY